MKIVNCKYSHKVDWLFPTSQLLSVQNNRDLVNKLCQVSGRPSRFPGNLYQILTRLIILHSINVFYTVLIKRLIFDQSAM